MSDTHEAMYTSLVLDERLVAMRKAGYMDRDIARATGLSTQNIVKRIGKRGALLEGRKKAMHGISVSPERYDAAKAIALRLGLVQRTGSKTGEGSVGRLVEEIGAGRVIVKKTIDEDLADFGLHLPDVEGGTDPGRERDDHDGEVDAAGEGEDLRLILPVPSGGEDDYSEGQAGSSDATHPEAL